MHNHIPGHLLPAAFAQDNYAWENSALNTTKNANYMQQDEKDMIYEINRLRSNPPRYAKMFVAVRLKMPSKFIKHTVRATAIIPFQHSIKTITLLPSTPTGTFQTKKTCVRCKHSTIP